MTIIFYKGGRDLCAARPGRPPLPRELRRPGLYYTSNITSLLLVTSLFDSKITTNTTNIHIAIFLYEAAAGFASTPTGAWPWRPAFRGTTCLMLLV